MEKASMGMEELTKQAHDLKTKWYGLAKKTEDLKDFKSGFDEGFKGAVKSIYDDIEAAKEYVDSFEHPLKEKFPDKRSDLTWMTKKVFRHLEDLRVMAKKDYDVLNASAGLSQDLLKLTSELEKTNAKLKTAEKKSGDSCRKYFDRKNEYTRELQTIEEKVKKKLDTIRDKFLEMTTPIVEGHNITMDSKDISPSSLFETLSEKPEDVEKVLVVKKGGLFAKKSEKDLAKTSVLKYVSGEILEGVTPIMKEKNQLISKLKTDYEDLPALEKACEDAEKARKKLEKPVEEKKAKISDIKKSEFFKFSDYDGILETREQYLDKIKEADKDFKEYLDFALLNLKDFIALEPDVEKRKLLSDIKAAKEKARLMEDEAVKAKESLQKKTIELTKISAAKDETQKKLDQAAEKLKNLEKDKTDLKKRLDDLNKSVTDFEKHILSNIKSFESDVASKLSRITLKDIGDKISSSIPDSGKKKEEEKVSKKVKELRGKKK